jgi:hypothetical protein
MFILDLILKVIIAMSEKQFIDLLGNNTFVWFFSVVSLGFHSVFILFSIFAKLKFEQILLHSIIETIAIFLVIPGIWSLIFSLLNIHKLGLKFQKFGSILLVLSYLLIVLSCGLESLGL